MQPAQNECCPQMSCHADLSNGYAEFVQPVFRFSVTPLKLLAQTGTENGITL